MKYPKEYLNEIKLRLKVSHVVGKTVQLNTVPATKGNRHPL